MTTWELFSLQTYPYFVLLFSRKLCCSGAKNGRGRREAKKTKTVANQKDKKDLSTSRPGTLVCPTDGAEWTDACMEGIGCYGYRYERSLKGRNWARSRAPCKRGYGHDVCLIACCFCLYRPGQLAMHWCFHPFSFMVRHMHRDWLF